MQTICEKIITVKSKKRTWIVDQILDCLKDPNIYNTIDCKNRKEDYIKQYMHKFIIDRLEAIHQQLYPGLGEQTARKKARESLLWESDRKTTVNNVQFFGVQHRPDFLIQLFDLKIAVEIKKGDNGFSIREGLGQSLVYSTNYDFTVYLFIDTSKDLKVKKSLASREERFLIMKLWENLNIRFDVA